MDCGSSAESSSVATLLYSVENMENEREEINEGEGEKGDNEIAKVSREGEGEGVFQPSLELLDDTEGIDATKEMKEDFKEAKRAHGNGRVAEFPARALGQ